MSSRLGICGCAPGGAELADAAPAGPGAGIEAGCEVEAVRDDDPRNKYPKASPMTRQTLAMA
jgi:hypothetical protein